MVTMVNKFAAKIEEKKGAVTEDEVCLFVCLSQYSDLNVRLHTQTIQFKSYLLSVGIANPVTR